MQIRGRGDGLSEDSDDYHAHSIKKNAPVTRTLMTLCLRLCHSKRVVMIASVLLYFILFIPQSSYDSSMFPMLLSLTSRFFHTSHFIVFTAFLFI